MNEMLVTFNADINSKFVCLEFCKNFTFMLQIFIYTENVQTVCFPYLITNKVYIQTKNVYIQRLNTFIPVFIDI